MEKINREEKENLGKALSLDLSELGKKASNLVKKQKEDLTAFIDLGGEVTKNQTMAYMIEALEKEFTKRELATLLTDAWSRTARIVNYLESI